MATMMNGVNSLVNDINKYLPLAAVTKAMQAAGGLDSKIITDHVRKVEIQTRPNAYAMTIDIVMLIHWGLPKGEDDKDDMSIISERVVRMTDGAPYDIVALLEELLDFQPEDVLKFAAFV